MVKSYGKNRVRSTNLRTIRGAFPRFFSLMVMSFLGVFVFAGLMATAPDMIRTLDRNLDDHNAYDIRVISDMGLTQEDADAIAALDGVEAVEASRALDVIASFGDNDCVINIAALPKQLNTIDLTSGRLPEQADEIVVEDEFLKKEAVAIGDTVTLDSDSLTETTVTIVGTVDSALYYNNVMISQNRGNTGIGSGTIKYYAFGTDDLFDMDYFTVIYLTVSGAAGEITSESGYTAAVDPVAEEIEAIAAAREQARYDSVRADAQQELDDARSEADDKLDDAKQELDDAKDTLDDAKQTLDDAGAELSDGRAQLDDAKQALDSAAQTLTDSKVVLDETGTQLSDARTQLDSREAELAAAKQTLDETGTALSGSKAQLEAAWQQLSEQEAAYAAALNDAGLTEDTLSAAAASAEAGVSELEAGIESCEAGLTALRQQSAALEPDSAEAQQLSARIAALEQQEQALQAQLAEVQAQLDGLNTLTASGSALSAARQALEEKQAEYDAGCAQYQAGTEAYEDGAAQLSAAEEQYAASYAQYESGLAAYSEGAAAYESSRAAYESGETEYAERLQEYNDGLAEYEDGLAEYEDGLAEYNSSKEDAEAELSDAEQQLDELALPTWYVYDRTGSSTYNDYIDDSNSIRNLGKLFPIVFFAVAVLVSLISMNRMVEENRLEIGTMKSMGFPDSMILSKYLTFSLLATILGGALGAAGGLVIIPELIFYIYSILFTLPSLALTLQPAYTILGFVLTVLCVCGTSVWTVFRVLQEKPAALLRQKPPKNGRRILLERFPLLWNHMKFSRKVTARNIFRYKKRVLVTIGGIAGCTALMLTGFGVKDAIIDVPSAQYYDIYQFDATAYVSDYGEDGITAAELLSLENVTAAVPTQRITADIENINGFLQIFAEDADLNEVALLRDTETGELLKLEPGKAIINEKLAAMSGLKVGDTVTLTDVDNRTLSIEIGGIAKNYIEHFVFIDAETYAGLGYAFEPNLLYLHTTDLDQTQKDALASEVLLNEHVLNFTYRDTLIDNVDNSLQSLNSVVLILIVLSALLAFVVLYNLSNININERKREIATLKVLGFYNNEVDSYITKENILLTVLGIGLGLVLGIFLSHAVVSTIEVEKCRFINTLKPMSYVWTALMTASFTLIVNVITHFNLKRINMIDSLKSVE